MINETTITLTQNELTAILILATEFIRREEKGLNQGNIYQTSAGRQRWLKNCTTIIAKTDNALTHCLVTNEPIPPIHY